MSVASAFPPLPLHDALPIYFVSDAVNLPLISAKERGAGGGHIRFNMARGSMNSHISQFPIGTYKKADVPAARAALLGGNERDRKSTRLNSRHVAISYAVFGL